MEEKSDITPRRASKTMLVPDKTWLKLQYPIIVRNDFALRHANAKIIALTNVIAAVAINSVLKSKYITDILQTQSNLSHKTHPMFFSLCKNEVLLSPVNIKQPQCTLQINYYGHYSLGSTITTKITKHHEIKKPPHKNMLLLTIASFIVSTVYCKGSI
jgi:hypothetical protein